MYSEVNKISLRYLLKVALNLYSIQFEFPPLFAGEIDLLESCGSSGNKELDRFCSSFLALFSGSSSDFNKVIERISEQKTERTDFFLMCCAAEVDFAKEEKIPLIFYWNDYFLYKKTKDFSNILTKAQRALEDFLRPKQQYSISQIEKFVKLVIDTNEKSFLHLDKILLYGSLARGTNTEFSDIDLLLEFSEKDPTNALVARMFANEFAKNCGTELDYNYVIKGQTNAFFDWIKSYGVKIYEKND